MTAAEWCSMFDASAKDALYARLLALLIKETPIDGESHD